MVSALGRPAPFFFLTIRHEFESCNIIQKSKRGKSNNLINRKNSTIYCCGFTTSNKYHRRLIIGASQGSVGHWWIYRSNRPSSLRSLEVLRKINRKLEWITANAEPKPIELLPETIHALPSVRLFLDRSSAKTRTDAGIQIIVLDAFTA